MAIRRARPKDHPEPLTRVVRFDAADGVGLAGLLYEPERRSTRAALFLHGTGGGSVFESARTNLLARELTDAGIAFFPFNNRGAHVIKRLRSHTRRVNGGMAYEKIRDCVPDIDGAIRELRRRGYRDFYLIGHSTGANKIAVYDHYKKCNPVKAYVLLGGADDTGMIYDQLGPRRFASTLEKARSMIREGRAEEFVPASVAPYNPMSWRAWYDMANPNGDYNIFPFLEILRGVRLSRRPRFRHLRGIRKPALFLYGDRDEYCYGDVSACVAVLADALAAQPNVELAILKDANHGFAGREGELGQVIAGWLG